MKYKQTRSDRLFMAFLYITLTLVMITILYPLWYVVIASVSNPLDVFNGKVVIWPSGYNVEAYKRVFQNNDIFLGYKNTLIYTVVGTLIAVSITIAAAFPLARRKLYGRGAIMFYFMFTMFFSGGLIPTYLVADRIGINNTRWAILLIGSVSVYNIIVARTFIANTIVDDLYEAAEIDGANDLLIFFKLVLPLSAPILAVLTLFYGVYFWNNYFTALIYIQDRTLRPLQVFLREILLIDMADSMVDGMELDISKYMVSQSLKYAVIIVSSVPMLVLYPLLQKFFVKGVMIGSVKG